MQSHTRIILAFSCIVAFGVALFVITAATILPTEPLPPEAYQDFHADNAPAPAPAPEPARALPPASDYQVATIARVIDADTLEGADGTVYRLALVDAPERGDYGAAAATAFTAKHCPPGTSAAIDVDDGQPVGPYGRTIAVVYCGPSAVADVLSGIAPPTAQSLNADLLAAGHACADDRFIERSEFGWEAWPYTGRTC